MKLKKKHYKVLGILLILLGAGILGSGFGLYAIGVKNVGYWTLTTLDSEMVIGDVTSDNIPLKMELFIPTMFVNYSPDTVVIGKVYVDVPDCWEHVGEYLVNMHWEYDLSCLSDDKLFSTFQFNSHSDWVCDTTQKHPISGNTYGYNCSLSFDYTIQTQGKAQRTILVGYEIPEWNYDTPIDTIPHFVTVNISTAMNGEIDEETGEQEGVDTIIESDTLFLGDLDTSESTIGEPEMSPMMVGAGVICLFGGILFLMRR